MKYQNWSFIWFIFIKYLLNAYTQDVLALGIRHKQRKSSYSEEDHILGEEDR